MVNNRLAHEDSTYWLLEEALDWSVVLQLVWRIDGLVDPALLERVNAAFGAGPLHRLLVPPRIAGARPYWAEAGAPPPLLIDAVGISEADVEAWAGTEMRTVSLDPLAGRCWRLRAVSTSAGNTVVSLCALHLVTDGRGMVGAAAAAFARAGSGESPPQVSAAGGSARKSMLADAGDVVRLLGASLGGVVRAVWACRPDTGKAAFIDPRLPRESMKARAPQAIPRSATVSVPTQCWDEVARRHGGTANSLFVAVVSGLLRTSGYAELGSPIKVGVPVDRRAGADDERANATAGVSVILTDDPVAGGDLTRIRAACKEAFARLSAGRRPAMMHLLPLVWLLPSALVVRGVGAGSGMPDAVTSNLGEIPVEAASLPGHRGTAAFRGIAQGVDADGEYRFGDGVQSWLIRTPEWVTFSLLGFDEKSFSSDELLAKLLAEELSAWGIDYEIW